MSEIDNRKADGTFGANNNANPEGKNGHNTGWQRYGDRLQKWLAMPFTELQMIIDDVPNFNKLSTIDCVCAQQAYDMRSGVNKRLEREDALNRIEGRPTQKVEANLQPFNIFIDKNHK